jgi:hypothetical protein
MDKWEDYKIKVLDMAPLIIVTLPMVSSFSSTCGCLLQVEWSSSRTISLLFSLACGWPHKRMALYLANGGASNNLGLKDLRVQEKGGEPAPEWARPAGLGRPAQAHADPVRSPLRSRGSSCIYALCPPPLAPFWRCHHHVQDGGSPCMKCGLLRFNPRGCSFVTLRSLPPLGLISSNT